MKRKQNKPSVMVQAELGDFTCCVLLLSPDGKGAPDSWERLNVAPSQYLDTILERVSQGWSMPDGAALNLRHQLRILGTITC